MITQPIDARGVATVVAMKDPILRNLWITQSYFDFSTRLDALLGARDHTWCGFAVWASGHRRSVDPPRGAAPASSPTCSAPPTATRTASTR